MTLPYKLVGIAAVSENGVIGNGLKIPWHLPEDFSWFKKTTMGHTLIMGRATYTSIGKPLPGRRTLILTRTPKSETEISDLDTAIVPSGIAFLCGGSEIYSSYLFECGELLITHVKGEFSGDKFFPYFFHKFDPIERITENEKFYIVRYSRKNET